MFQQFLKRLRVDEHEAPRVQFLWNLRFLYQIGFLWSWTVITAIFLEIFGIQNLLFLFLVDAWLLLFGSFATHLLFLRIKINHFLQGMTIGTFVFLGLAWVFKENIIWFFTCLILAKDLCYAQLNIGLYRKNESVLSPVEAQRLMPIIDSAVTIGTIVGAAVFVTLLQFFPTKMVLFFWSIPLLFLVILLAMCSDVLREIPQLTPPEKKQSKNSIHEAMEAVKSVPFLRYLSVLVCAQAALFTVVGV